jgi:hypothetical protein
MDLLLDRTNGVVFLWSTEEKTEMYHCAFAAEQTEDTKEAIN